MRREVLFSGKNRGLWEVVVERTQELSVDVLVKGLVDRFQGGFVIKELARPRAVDSKDNE